tara:strand:+ start:1251 stop:3143 length:1893 start_codon:yes stop_codon:yes gene_type:complete
MAVNLSLFAGAGWQFFDNNGVPLAGGLLYTYAAGTTTPLATYTTSAGNIANANPIVLNSAGRLANEVWLTTGSSYKFILQTSLATQIGSYDNISGSNDFTSIYAALAASSGSSLIGFIAAGGATAETVQTKLRQIVTPQDFGAVDDGTTVDRTAINSAIAASDRIYAPTETAYLASKIGDTGTILLGAKTLLDSGYYKDTGNVAEFITIPASSTQVTLRDVKITAGTGIALHQNLTNSVDTIIYGPRVDSAGYSILSNENSDGSDGFVILGGVAASSTADAVNFNHPGTAGSLATNYNYSAIGMMLSSGNFAYSISGTLGWAAIGNHIRTSTLEAFHVEHSQRRGVIGFNTVKAAVANGVQLLPPLTADPAADPVVVMGNSITHTGAPSTTIGINVVNNAQTPGYLISNSIVGNVLRDFGVGISHATSTQLVDNNVVILNSSAGTGLQASRQSYMAGTNAVQEFISGTHVAVEIGAASTVGSVIINGLRANGYVLPAAVLPTILTHSDGRGTGGKCYGFFFKISGSHAGGGADNINLFQCGANTRMRGNLSVSLDNNATGLFYSAAVHWDGTTLTVGSTLAEKPLEQYAGSFSAGTFNSSAGLIRFNFNSTPALSDVTFVVDFSGIFFQV